MTSLRGTFTAKEASKRVIDNSDCENTRLRPRGSKRSGPGVQKPDDEAFYALPVSWRSGIS
ncbi:MAG TPA: hypothetical protein VGE93_07355 [Bryobacteraceae bacterium]